MRWQLITPEQAIELKSLGVYQRSEFSFYKLSMRPVIDFDYTVVIDPYYIIGAAYTLSEIASMLRYEFVPRDVKVAAERLIEEIKIGTSKVEDINARLIEAQKQ